MLIIFRNHVREPESGSLMGVGGSTKHVKGAGAVKPT